MFVNHIFARQETLPPAPAGLYEYVIGSNGIFVRASRPGLEALIWVAATNNEIRGLAQVQPFVRVYKPVPAWLVGRMFEMAFRAGDKEILFYLSPNPWRLALPEQVQSKGSVFPVDPYASGSDTMIEIHSHHNMQPYFSKTDDHDEQAGFRIFAVLGNLGHNPSIAVRAGVYGHFWGIPARWIFDLPAGVHDVNSAARAMDSNNVEIEEPEVLDVFDD
ncbi:MAG: hypothetical protein GYA58_03380 [Anaerolineaceae bacterium]|nr:hypothetical protein [Anaerolineaceae bacterium]